MKLVSYIDEAFLKEIDEVYNDSFTIKHNEVEYEDYLNRVGIQQSILATLLASEIRTTLSKKECINIFQKSQDESAPQIARTWKEKIIYESIIKGRYDKINQITLSDPNGIYFIKEEFENKNVAVINEFKDCTEYFSTQTGYLNIDESMNGVETLQHTANSLLLYDPYIFEDLPNRPLKIPNLIKLLQTIIINDKTYFLSIVSRNQEGENRTEVILNKLDQIQAIFPNVTISAFVPFKTLFRTNRYFFTNYMDGYYNHIFDRDGQFTPNFIFCEIVGKQNERVRKIADNYIEINKKLNLITESYDHTGLFSHGCRVKFGDILQNPIFAL